MALVLRILRFVFSSVWLTAVVVVGVPVVAAATILAGLIVLPLPATIPTAHPAPVAEPTTIYDRYGDVIATLAQSEHDVPVAQSAIPAILKEAVIADEDRNFYHHGGVDLRGTIRAAVADIRSNRAVQGGSTITQQYVKLAFTGGQRNIYRKIREAILASQLDRAASKDDILYHYLTLVFFGDGNYGIGAAARYYFHVDVSQLDASQSAALAGLIPAPSDRAPLEHLADAEEYRQLVLGKMRQQGYLTAPQYRAALAAHLALASTPHPPAGATLVYPPPAPAAQYPDFVGYVENWLLDHYPASEVFGGGLRVQTTLDPRIQQDATSSVQATLSGTAPPIDMTLASVEPQTGFVEALVAGRAFSLDPADTAPYSKDNFATSDCANPPAPPVEVPASCWSLDPKTGHYVKTGHVDTAGGNGRQPGSSWKPFVLATAFAQGILPSAVYPAPGVYTIPGCTVLRGKPASSCQIHNDELGRAGATETLAQAMAASTNTVYAQLVAQVGCPAVATTARTLGVRSAYWSTSRFFYCPSYALGEVGVSALDMASAYGVFDDHGQEAAPTPILQILDGAGRLLVDNITHAPATTATLAANVADNVTNVLQGVLAPGGTGTAASLGSRPAAGKTGTTSNYVDAWFVGYTPTLSTAVWMGRDDSETKTLGDVKGVYPVFGGTWPARTWKAFMTKALSGVPATPFTQPAPIVPPAAVLAAKPTTRPRVTAGSPSATIATPTGGPYQQRAPTPQAPTPSQPTVPSTTTTVPVPDSTEPTTTSTTSVPAGG